MFTRKIIVGMILAVLVSMSTMACGATYYVDPNGSDDANGSPEEPFATIQKGIVASLINGDTVIVGDGVYTGYWNRHIQFLGKEVTVRSANGPENCIIDVEEAAQTYGFYICGSENSNSVLDGFTITNAGDYAIACDPSSLTIKNCIIKNTIGKGRGIGIFSFYGPSNPTISGCVIGGDVDYGIYCSNSSVTVSRCTLSGNTDYGVYCTNGDVNIDSSMIVNNGNGIYLASSDNFTVSNCTIAENDYGLKCIDADTVAEVDHCIFWDNSVEIYANNSGADITVEYCDVKDGQERVDVPEGTLTWNNNIDADPLFVDAEDDDFHLQQFSPCVDAGDPNYDPGTTDVDGQPRRNGVVDMGADEAGLVWYVDVDAIGSETGLSWEDAFTSIQDGIDAASAAHDDLIAVAEGTYSESIDFDGKPITVKKVKHNEVADAVINPGDTGANVVTLDSGEDAQSVLHGFILTGGKYGVYCGSSSTPRILNCVIKANSDSGVYLSGAGAVEIRNDTIIDNSTAGIYVASGGAPSVTNCIVWNNNDDLYGCSATYSCIEDCDDASGEGNICGDANDPLFVDPENGDYHLDACSPCMDAGNGDGDYEGEEDIYHSPRLQGPYVDMGADEADPNIWTSPGSFNVTLHEGGTDTDTLTIGNSGKGDLHFNIWPDNEEALEMSAAGMGEGQSPGYETESSENEIVLDYDFSEPIVTNDGIYDHLIIEGLDNFVQVGAPIVPMWRVKALVPYGKRVVDIQLRILSEHKLPGRYFLPPAPEPISVSSHNEVLQIEPDPAIYGSNKSWPGEYYKDPLTQSKRGYQLYFVKLFPVQYKPKSGKVSYVSKLRLTIKLADKTTETILRPTRKLKSALRKKVDNPKALGTYPLKPVGRSADRIIMSAEGAGYGFVPGQSYDYIIITSEYLLKVTPEPWNFQRLRDSKIARGFSAAIVTTEWIYDEYDGTGEDDQALIRNFLIDVYDWHTGSNDQYALLGGSDEIIPERKFYVYVSGTDFNVPCDMYYGCLDPCDCNFNYDGDGYYGESNDGIDGNEIDLKAEIYIGRAGVKDTEDVSNFVKKTLIYNATISDYLPRISMVGEQLTEAYWAKTYLEYIRLGTVNSYGFENHEWPDFFDFNTAKNLYEQDYIWNVNELIDLMNNGVHVLNHLAHSLPLSIGKFSVYRLPQLTNEDCYFIYSQGCNAGAFDQGSGQCFAEQVTVKPYGAFAAIMNSRKGKIVVMGGSSLFNQKFWDTVLHDDPNVRALEIGRANQVSKEDNFLQQLESTGANRLCYFQLNVFGDPEQQFLFGQSRDSAWLEAEPVSGSVEGEDSTEIDIDFDVGSLAPGTYEGDIIISSNDYLNPMVTVPVTMTVLQKPPAVTPYDIFETIRVRSEGSFTPCCITYTLTNNGTAPINWEASNTEVWLDIEPSSGTLYESEEIDVNVSVNLSAYDLTAGCYFDTITIANLTDGYVHERGAIITVLKEHFTEVFESDELDIQNQTLTFYPNGSYDFYTVCRQSASEFPTDPNEGTALTLYSGEVYDEERIDINDQKQVSLYGEPNDYLYVLGNGIITFESDSSKREALLRDISISSHFGSPSVSAFAAWLAPWDGGDISYKQLADRIAVTFEDVPEWDKPNNLNSFQVELFFDGRIRVTHLNLALYWPSQGSPAIVGLSEGNGTPGDFFESDLSEYSSSHPGVHNIDKNFWYMSLQQAIDDANDGDTIEIYEGTHYHQEINFKGKAITLCGTDPNDWDVVEATIIDGNDSSAVISFDSGEDANSILKGLTIKNAGSYGIKCSGTSPAIQNCIIEDSGGRGINITGSSAPVVEQNKIRNNSVGIAVGIAGAATIKNNWIYNNSNRGIRIDIGSNAVIENNTIVGNTSYGITSDTTSTATISNCIIWDNGDDLYNCSATYSCIEDSFDANDPNYTGSISDDPNFFDAANGNYHLSYISPCIGAGDPNYTPGPNEVDIDGHPRICAGVIDMGADESLCPGDVTATVTGYIPPSPFPLPDGTPASFDSSLWTGPDGKTDTTDVQALTFLLVWDGVDLVVTPVPDEALPCDVTATVTGLIIGDPNTFDKGLWTGPDGKLDDYDLQALINLIVYDGTDLVYTCP